MKHILLIMLLILGFSCEQQELPAVSADEELGVEADGSGAAQVEENEDEVTEDDDDHPSDGGDGQHQPTTLKAAVMVSRTSESLRLGEKKSVVVTILADSDFPGGSITVDIDRSSITADDGSYVKTNLSQTYIASLNPGGSLDIDLDLETETMAPSFSPKEIKVIISQAGLEKEASLTLEVLPEIEVAIISAQNTPYMYNRSRSTCLQPHEDGVQVIFSNRTADFTDGNEPCIHTSSPLQHCNQNNAGSRMKQNETYIVGRPGNPRKVAADYNNDGAVNSNDIANAIYYDHFNSGDNNGKRLYFNIVPGTETTYGSGGNNCE